MAGIDIVAPLDDRVGRRLSPDWPDLTAATLRAMAILVDAAIWRWRGLRWAHLVSDANYDELHDFAGLLGIPRRAFQGDHYDVPEDLRVVAVSLGAVEVDGRVLVRRLRAAGLRRVRTPSAQTAASSEPMFRRARVSHPRIDTS